MSKTIYCFSANRVCHHDDYHLLINKFINTKNIKDFKEKLKILFSKKSIIFLDIDAGDLLFTPLIILRTLWGAKSCGISVRTEYLLQNRSFKEIIINKGRLVYFKSLIKRLLFYSLKRFSTHSIISIHKDHAQMVRMRPYVDTFIYDPQLWDLNLLGFSLEKPKEVSDDFFIKNNNIILIAGRLNEQRSRKELISFLKQNQNQKNLFLIAGMMEEQDFHELSRLSNCLLINRFLSNGELIYLMKNCHAIYCYYTNSRPSGFFGRALQLNKPIIVRKESYLHSMFKNYTLKIPINNLNELDAIDKYQCSGVEIKNIYSDTSDFKKLLQQL